MEISKQKRSMNEVTSFAHVRDFELAVNASLHACTCTRPPSFRHFFCVGAASKLLRQMRCCQDLTFLLRAEGRGCQLSISHGKVSLPSIFCVLYECVSACVNLVKWTRIQLIGVHG